jgi:hypothetical protein
MHLIIIVFISACAYSNTAEWSDSIVTKGVMNFIPDAPAVTIPSQRVVLDTTQMIPDNRFLYDNLPECKVTQHGQAPLFLKN